MTADVNQLPAAPWLGYDPERGDLHGFSHNEVRAIITYATAAKDAEIEALRTEVNTARSQAEFYRTERNKNHQKAERLEGAMRLIESAKGRGFGIDYARGVAQSTLRYHGREKKDG